MDHYVIPSEKVIMISKKQIGLDLKKMIESKVKLEEIADWAYDIFYKNANDLDPDLESMLLTLFTMKGGSEYHLNDLQLRLMASGLIYADDKEPYTKERVGLELMSMLLANANIGEITGWAYELLYFAGELSGEIRDIVTIIAMADEPEFECSKEELTVLANMLIYGIADPKKKFMDLLRENDLKNRMEAQ